MKQNFNLKNSPVHSVFFEGMSLFIKRDDLLDENFSGNKARKFQYFLENSFPNIKKLVSYGSNQSNAMYSLSVLAKIKGWEFIYFTDHISPILFTNPSGNYKAALQNGMIIKISHQRKEEAFLLEDENTLVVLEGGAMAEAEYGLKILAKEIEDFAKLEKIDNLDIFLPSGTGATALFLQKNLPYKVYTTQTVGSEEYLQKQFFELDSNKFYHPQILSSSKKYRYGKTYKEFYDIWSDLKDKINIEFDLIYDPKGWIALIENREVFKNKILYIHQGGIKGNESMLERYGIKYEN